jgi:hypothetical protein
MTYLYSPTSKGFYNDSIHSVIPSDAIPLTDEEYNNAFNSLHNGESIKIGNHSIRFEISKDQGAILESVRKKRDALLSASDWSLFPDSPLSTNDKKIWKEYRQQLRDMMTDLDINNIIWPVRPGEK